jgi:hypothetical protein
MHSLSTRYAMLQHCQRLSHSQTTRSKNQNRATRAGDESGKRVENIPTCHAVARRAKADRPPFSSPAIVIRCNCGVHEQRLIPMPQRLTKNAHPCQLSLRSSFDLVSLRTSLYNGVSSGHFEERGPGQTERYPDRGHLCMRASTERPD